MIKKDISANLYQRGAPQYKLKSFVTMATYWVPDLPKIKSISGHLQLSIFIIICKWYLVCMILQAYKYVSQSLWPRLAFLELKIGNILQSIGWGMEE